jgi:hypothetical protein
MAATGGDPTPCMGFMVNDGDHDFNGVDGRLTMNFNIPCVPIIEAREVVAEFVEVGTGECGSGDMNADGTWNVLDVVALVTAVLSSDDDPEVNCNGDMNADGNTNVLDVVQLVNCVLEQNCIGSGRINDATSVEFNVIGNEVTMTADGIVGGVQMTLRRSSSQNLIGLIPADISEYFIIEHLKEDFDY